MKKLFIIFVFLSSFSLLDLKSMGRSDGPAIKVYDFDDVVVHEHDCDGPSSGSAPSIKVQVKSTDSSNKVTPEQAKKIVEQVKKQSWFTNLIQKMRQSFNSTNMKEKLIILTYSIVAGYSLAITYGYDPLGVCPALEKFVIEYNKIGTR